MKIYQPCTVIITALLGVICQASTPTSRRIAIAAKASLPLSDDDQNKISPARYHWLPQNLKGADDGQFGDSVAVSGDGNTIAIHESNPSQSSGTVYLYTKRNDEWTKKGRPMDAENSNAPYTRKVSLNEDGSIVALVAPPAHDGGRSRVQVWNYDGEINTWYQLGSDIDGSIPTKNTVGLGVSMSDDGTRLAVSDGSGEAVRVFDWDSDVHDWKMIGEEITSKRASASLSGDGKTLAISEDDQCADTSHVRVYVYDWGTWVPLGDRIEERATGEGLSLSGDGKTLAAGDNGTVRIYRLDDDNITWSKMGDDITGLGVARLSLVLSGDGDKIAIGSVSEGEGKVKVFGLYGESWVSVGEELEGVGSFGFSVALDRGGDTLLSGNPFIELVHEETDETSFSQKCSKSTKSSKSAKSSKSTKSSRSTKSSKNFSSKSVKSTKSAKSVVNIEVIKDASSKSMKSSKGGTADKFTTGSNTKSSKSYKGTTNAISKTRKSPKTSKTIEKTLKPKVTQSKSSKSHEKIDSNHSSTKMSKSTKNQKKTEFNSKKDISVTTKSSKSTKSKKGMDTTIGGEFSQSVTKSGKSSKSSKSSNIDQRTEGDPNVQEKKSSKVTKNGKRRNRDLIKADTKSSFVRVFRLQKYIPSDNPSIGPSTHPSFRPSLNPTLRPSVNPSPSPSGHPSLRPSVHPSLRPSGHPSPSPSDSPSASPSRGPTKSPSINPTKSPSSDPSYPPSVFPTPKPSIPPSRGPTPKPSIPPSRGPTPVPTPVPTPDGISSFGYAGIVIVSLFFAGSLSVFYGRYRETEPSYDDIGDEMSELGDDNGAPDSDRKIDAYLSHNWGIDSDARNNHERVNKVNDALKKSGIRTCLYGEQLRDDTLDRMKQDIDRSMVMIVFVTDKYIANVAGEGNCGTGDQCKQEFEYALRQKGAMNMIPVVMEESCADVSAWAGEVGDNLRCHVPRNFTRDGKLDVCVRELLDDILRRKDAEREVSSDNASMRSIILEDGSL